MVTLNINIALVIQLVNFLLLMAALNYLLYRPLRKMVRERAEVFGDLRTRAAKLKGRLGESEARIKEYTAVSIKMALEKKAEVRMEGVAAQKELLSKKQAEAAADLERARGQLAMEVAAAKEALDQETQVFAWEIAGKILGRSL